MLNKLDLLQRIQLDADQCVKCGLCLPKCPTYRITQSENESPRGRISLMQALASGQISGDNIKLNTHLDRCLTCRACEAACPADVKYGELIDNTRALISITHPTQSSRLTRWLGKAIIKNRGISALQGLLAAGDKLGVRKLADRIGLIKLIGLRRINNLLPNKINTIRRQPPSEHPNNTEAVQLFTGCVNSILESDTLNDALAVLRNAQIDVTIPPGPVCCGALFKHSGDAKTAEAIDDHRHQQLANNIPILYTASGCGAELAKDNSIQAQSLWSFLATRKLSLKSQNEKIRILVHEPCTLRNVTRDTQALYQLLKQIPDVEIVPAAENQWCCGAAGSYMIDQPEFANQLRELKLNAILEQKADVIVTPNVGCRCHLQAGLRERKLPLQVKHPISIIAEMLATP